MRSILTSRQHKVIRSEGEKCGALSNLKVKCMLPVNHRGFHAASTVEGGRISAKWPQRKAEGGNLMKGGE